MYGSLRPIGIVCGLMVVGAVSTAALATPTIDSAVLNLRLWNDCPTSALTTSNLYPGSIWIQDANLNTEGYANRHNFRLSGDGGISAANFMNGDAFGFFSDVTMTGTGDGEGGLNVSPWWSQNFDGEFMLKTTGEIAVFGGRLPFYSFTANQGVTYTKGETVRTGFIYAPRGLSQADPATIEYVLIANGVRYTSGAIRFDQGNPAEGYGSWGMLNSAQLGGTFQPYIQPASPDRALRIEFSNIGFVPEPAALALLGLVSAFALRRAR